MYFCQFIREHFFDPVGLHLQGEFGVLVLPECVWTEEHVQLDPGTGQR